MKHIFKKRHHLLNRSNDVPPTTQQSSTSSSSSSSSPAAPPQSSASFPVPATSVSHDRTSTFVVNRGDSPPVVSSTASSNSASSVATASAPTRQQQDYFSSEEDFQVQLALALSVSSSSSQDCGKLLNSGGDQHLIQSRFDSDAAADLQSRQYWDYGVLDYEEKVTDGFYDVYSLSTDPAIRGTMPSLAVIEANPSVSDFEVVVVNRKFDTALEEVMQIALCYAEDCPPTDITVLVQRLAELVTEQMGGPVKDANFVLARWMERSTELRTSLHTAVLPIGSLKLGLSRHRALLFKVLADIVKVPCRLVKGSHYTGIEDDAVNVIKLPNESEFLVDLMAAPGTLISADVHSGKDSQHPKSDKLPNIQASSASVAAFSKPNLLGEQYSQGGTKVFSGNVSERVDNFSSFSGASTSSGSPEFSNTGLPADQMESGQPWAIVSSHKGVRGPNIVEKGSRAKQNIIPYNDKRPDDPKNLFADLNPFQIKGSGKDYLKGNLCGKRIDELQQPNKNLNSGLPPAPLMWKSRHANNEVPQSKKYDRDSPFQKNINVDVNCSVPSIPYATLAASEKVSANIFQLPNKSHQAGEVKANALALASSANSVNQLSPGSDQIIDHKKTPLEDPGVRQNVSSTVTKESIGDGNSCQGVKNTREDRVFASDFVLVDTRSPCSSVSSTTTHDAVIDDVNECEIPWEDLEIGERIGLGSYGEVYRADWNGTEVAVKKFLDQDFFGAALSEFRREVRIMQRLRHPNIVLFMGAVTRPPNLSIITEFLPRGSLYKIIHHPQCQIDEKQRIKMARDVAKGMNCLHTSIPTIVHRDLKSPNLLVDNNWNVKVCDFGLSRLKHNTFLSSKSTAGTPEWMAPEVLRNEPSNEKCDIYSFGIILWELATLKLPWSGMNPMQVVGAVGFQNRRLEIPKEVDPLVARIIWECWQTDPNLRPSFAQLAVALKPLQWLVSPPHVDQPNSSLQQEVSVNSTP